MGGSFNERIFLIVIIVTVHIVSAQVFEGDHVYAVKGASVRLPCSQPTRPRLNTQLNGDWTWRSAGGTLDKKIVSFMYSSTGFKGDAPMKHRVRISGGIQQGDYAIDIQSLQKADEGKFTCKFHIRHEEAFKQINLHVLQATTNASGLVIEGETVVFSCKTPSGSVSWTGPGGERGSGESLTVRATPRQSGTWTCRVQHQAMDISATCSLQILGFLSPPARPLYVGLGSSLNLSCTLNQLPRTLGFEAVWLHGGAWKLFANRTGGWWAEGGSERERGRERGKGRGGRREREKEMEMEGREVAKGDLTVQLNVKRIDQGGSYRCQVTMDGRTLGREFRVHVVEVTSHPDSPVSEGSEVAISCQLYPPSPLARLSLRPSNASLGAPSLGSAPPGNPSLGSAPPGNPSLASAPPGGPSTGAATRRFPSVLEGDGGEWQCEVTEEGALRARVRYQLDVQGGRIFGLPMMDLLLFVSLALTFLLIVLVTVTCLVIRYRRKKQARARRLRHPLCRRHRNQLSHQPLCPLNEYMDGDRPLPPFPNVPPKRSIAKRT